MALKLPSINMGGVKAWLADIKTNRKKQMILGGSFAGVFVLAALVGVFLIMGGEGKKIEQVTEAVNRLAAARAAGQAGDIAQSVSPSFNDGGLNYRTVVKQLSVKEPGLKVNVQNVTLEGDTAKVSYQRTTMDNGTPQTRNIMGEVWALEGDRWRLTRLSPIDKALMAKKAGPKEPTKAATGTDAIRAEQKAEEPLDDDPEIAEKKKMAMEAGLPPGLYSPEDWKQQEQKILESLRHSLTAKFGVYTAEGKRDPFRSLVAGVTETGRGAGGPIERCDPNRKRVFLESFDLFSLQLVGIITGKENFALIETPNGNGYSVKEGMYMGRNCGKILAIKKNIMLVVEKIRDPRKGFVKVKREIKLKKQEGE